MLDAQEYLHLAMHASANGDHHTALNYLKSAAELEPANASVRYFMATEHAELGMYERAISGINETLALDPAMDIARFQLGLLHIQLQQLEHARATFTKLYLASNDSALQLFSGAYVALMDGNQPEAIRKLQEGLNHCDKNPPLKSDMTQLLDSLSKGDHQKDLTSNSTSSSILLGAYHRTIETS